MSDSSSLHLPIGQALTSDMMLGLKPSAPKSRSYRINVPSTNKAVFAPGDQMVFELPVSRKGTWLDQSQSYLKFSMQTSSSAAATVGGSGVYLDNSAYSVIQRLDIYNSSNLLETINEYGQLANFLLDTSLTQSDKAGLSTLIGTNNTNLSQSTIGIPAGGLGNTTNYYIGSTQLQTAGDRSGMSMATNTAINSAIPYTFCLPLLSGVIGVNASKMLPVGKLNAPIRCEFYLAANDDAIYYGSAGAGAVWQLVNVEMVLCYVELQDDSLSPSLQSGEQEYISTTTYRQASTYMPSSTAGEFTTLVPFRCASLTALYARFRPFATAVQGSNATAAYRKGASINPNLTSYYFRVGSSLYPNKPVYLTNGSLVGTGAEGYAELLKSFHALSSSIGNSALTYSNYNVSATATQAFSAAYGPSGKFVASASNTLPSTTSTSVDSHANGFAVGLELQSFSNRNDTILSGVSTLNTQVYFTGTVGSGLTAGSNSGTAYNYTIDFFGQMDMILVLQDGILSAKF